MRASTELLLWQLFSLAGELFRPSLRYADESFEGWAHRKGLLRQIQRLEMEAYLEKQPGGSADRIFRLTSKGRIAALGGKDPEAMWNREWDGRWRLFSFDLPQNPRRPRMELWRFLRDEGFGCLQGSVWISPDPMDRVTKRLKGFRHVASLALFEAVSIGGEKPSEIVHGAWDLVEIGHRWEEYQSVLRLAEALLSNASFSNDRLKTWMVEEQVAWKKVLEKDPLLPSVLLPPTYPGQKVWRERLSLWSNIKSVICNNGQTPKQPG